MSLSLVISSTSSEYRRLVTDDSYAINGAVFVAKSRKSTKPKIEIPNYPDDNFERSTNGSRTTHVHFT